MQLSDPYKDPVITVLTLKDEEREEYKVQECVPRVTVPISWWWL